MMRRAQPWLGTLVDIALGADSDETMALDGWRNAFAEVALVHRLMSFRDPLSDVTRFNLARAGDSVTVHPHTWYVLELAAQVYEESGGAFNIACAPILVGSGHLPACGPVRPLFRPAVTVFRLEPEQRVVKLAEAWIDLGGIAKGHAVDLAIAALRASGVRSACVNAGGDLRVFGEEAFPVAIRDPLAPTRARTHIHLHNEAMATSAPYFSRKGDNGQITSALLSGASGGSIVDPVSVSVRAPLCAVADALTKVVLGSGDPGHQALQRFHASAMVF